MNWNKLIEAAMAAPDKVPPDWLTCAQIAVKLNKTRSRMAQILRAAAENNAIEVRKFKIKAGQTVRPVPHYRLK